MVDTLDGGNSGVKTIEELRTFFETLVASSQQNSSWPRKVEACLVTMSPNMKKQMADMMRELRDLKME